MGAAGEEEQTQERVGCDEKILVSVRLRPLNDKEIARNEVSDWECIDDNTIIYSNNLSISERSMYPTAYSFDRVFSSKNSTRQVYEEGAKKVALSVVRGINSSVFAYGQTSSGKTYTMSGITEYTVADIYDYMETHKEREFVLKFCAMEIYNESVRDLLSADSSPLRLLDDPERGTVVERLTEETLRDWNHFKELLSVCEAQRQIGETALNETSSRSHQILRLTIDSLAREFLGCDKSSTLTATVNFVDLAGSERASQSLSAGTRLKEGCHINRSLLTLGTVIRKLSKGRNGHVPYRDSKLTRILQSSLGGNARTAVICTMSPARVHVEQSRNTLLFASCAKEVTTNAQVNLVMSDKALVKHLQRELSRMESELRDSGLYSVKSDLATLVREKDHEIDKLKKEITELTLQRDLARSQLEDLLQVVEDDRPPKVKLDHNYPQLRVRSSMDFEEPSSGITAVEGSPHMDNGDGSFDAAQYSDGHSSSTCNDQEEYSVQLPDSEDIFQCSISSPRLSISSVESSMQQDGTKKHIHINQVKVGREVPSDKLEESNPYGFVASNMSGLNSYAESPEEKSRISLDAFEDGDTRDQDLKSPQWTEDEEPNSIHHSFVITSSGISSPSLMEKENFVSGDMKLTRDGSFTSFRANSSSIQYEKIEKDGSDRLGDTESDFSGRPEGLEGKVSLLKFDVDSDHKLLSRNDSQGSIGDATGKDLNIKDDQGHDLEISDANLSGNGSLTSIQSASVKGLEVQDAGSSDVYVKDVGGNDEFDVQDVNNSCLEKDSARNTFASDREQMAELQQVNPHKDQTAPRTESKSTGVGKSVRDIGLDPIQDLQESPKNWPVEFKRLQREIIELWHACSIPLVHRSNFLLLFKGDPSDSIYMEVELRRLSFIKEKSQRGNRTPSDSSSANALRRERQMLSRRMNRLSQKDRQNLYRKWGIGLNSKHRRLQLAHRLWSDTRDMEHVAASAALVARLVGSVDADNAFKEMFGFSFAPQRRGNKNIYHSIKRSMKPLLSS